MTATRVTCEPVPDVVLTATTGSVFLVGWVLLHQR